MKKLIATLSAGVVLLTLSGCWSTTGMYVTSAGMAVETTESMAYMMAVRDLEATKARSSLEAIAKSDRPEQVVAAMAVFYANVGQKIERPKTWDERMLPWVQVLAPYFQGYMHNRSGESTAQIDGNNNTVLISRDVVDNASSKTVSMMPSVTQSTQVQTGETGEMNPAGTYSPTVPLTVDTAEVPVATVTE